MQDNALLDTVERYIRGEMLPEEKVFFEHVRKTNPDVDQLVVEHTLFLEQFDQYGEISRLKTALSDVHRQLAQSGDIDQPRPARVVVLWKKYKRVLAVAASIAGVTALGISGLVSYFSPKAQSQYEQLNRRLDYQEAKLNNVANKINNTSTPAAPIDFTSGGTGFLIDGKGYLVTSAHIFKTGTLVEVQNSLGSYQARVIKLDRRTDLALLKIEDTAYHPFLGLPYGFSRSAADLGENLFMLGYPRPEIVYNQGYLSAETGYEGDTLTFQMTIAANPGNSGTPVLNNEGEVIGILRGSQTNAQGVVFAGRSKDICQALDAMRTDSTLQKTDSTLSHMKIPYNSSLKGMERKQQIKRLEDYIFIVKSN